MADPIQQLISRTSYLTDGSTTVWNFSFSGGYLDPSHVKAFYKDASGYHEVPVTGGMFIGEFQLSIAPAIAAGAELTIYRDTPKTGPLVDFVDRSILTEASLDLSAKQAVFIGAEAWDAVAVLQMLDFTAALLGKANLNTPNFFVGLQVGVPSTLTVNGIGEVFVNGLNSNNLFLTLEEDALLKNPANKYPGMVINLVVDVATGPSALTFDTDYRLALGSVFDSAEGAKNVVSGICDKDGFILCSISKGFPT